MNVREGAQKCNDMSVTEQEREGERERGRNSAGTSHPRNASYVLTDEHPLPDRKSSCRCSAISWARYRFTIQTNLDVELNFCSKFVADCIFCMMQFKYDIGNPSFFESFPCGIHLPTAQRSSSGSLTSYIPNTENL